MSEHECLSADKATDFCTYGPPAERKRRWVILFDDPDKGTMVFDDEKEAHTAWDRANDNWTCTLFETSERKYQWAAGELRRLTVDEPQPTQETLVDRVKRSFPEFVEHIERPNLPLDIWTTWARRDDWHERFVGSDIRQMLGEIQRLREHFDNLPPSQETPKLPAPDEIINLIDSLTTPDFDTQKAFASHRRAWLVQCLQAALTLTRPKNK